LVKRALHHSGSSFKVIDSYAVIDFGFQVKSQIDETMQPAGLLLRQSHFRDITKAEQLDRDIAWKIESALREYGITTAYKKTTLQSEKTIVYDVLNVQGSDAGKLLFDFGGYRIADRFQNHAITLSDLFQKKIIPVFSAPPSPIQHTDPRYAPLFQSWGGEGTEERIWIRAREIAESFKNEGNPEKSKQEIKDLLDATSVIPSEPPSGPGSCVESLKRP
jgi:hypothetical protein